MERHNNPLFPLPKKRTIALVKSSTLDKGEPYFFNFVVPFSWTY